MKNTSFSPRVPATAALLRRASVVLLLSFVGIASAQTTAPIANVIIGGGERRCSSFTGSAAGRDCSADWDTILAQDPAFKGLSRDDISFAAEEAAPVFGYSLTPSTIDAVRNIPASLFDPQRKQRVLDLMNQRLTDPVEPVHLSWSSFEQLLPGALLHGDGGLTLAEIAMLRSALVDRTPAKARKVQGRSTLFSSNAASVAITQSFVAAARAANAGKKPLIGVVTASAGPHPFVDRDLNVFAMASAGADVVYLPLDGGYRQALDAQDCANVRYYYDSYANTNPERPVYHADLLFPDLSEQQRRFCVNKAELLNATLERLSGIYFSGGNQARHLESLVNKDRDDRYSLVSTQWSILQRRHTEGHLVVAGTSAGNHFQGGGLWRGKPVPMIGGGDSYDVLKAGYGTGAGPATEATELGKPGEHSTYAPVIYPHGGLGVFRFGVLDSHFSQRTREARLIRAVHDSGMDYGFGVDENTALLVSQADAAGSTHFTVLGAGGVFMVDLRQATANTNPQRHFVVRGARAHYLLPGDRASIDTMGDLQVTLQDSAPLLPTAPGQYLVTQDKLLDYGSGHFLRLATLMGLRGAQRGFGTTHNSKDSRSNQTVPFYSATLSRDKRTVFRGSAAATPGAANRVSYTGLVVALAPCDGKCQDAGPTPPTPQSTVQPALFDKLPLHEKN